MTVLVPRAFERTSAELLLGAKPPKMVVDHGVSVASIIKDALVEILDMTSGYLMEFQIQRIEVFLYTCVE